MTLDQIRSDMSWLSSKLEKRLAKYRRNYNRYCNNGRRSEDIREQYGNPLSFQSVEAGEDTGITPNLNVIKSAIDTHISKLSQTKVRPFFNPIVGTFKARKVCRAAQVYFDEFYELEDVYRKGVQAARFADVFEYGALWVDDETRHLYVLPPWEWYVDPAEYNYGKISRCMILQKQFPLHALKEYLKGKEGADLAQQLANDPKTKVERVWYYDLIEKKKHLYAGAVHLVEKPIEYSVPPVAMIYLEQPMKGLFSVSMADDLYTIQAQIDSLCERIHLALELSPANSIWVPEGSEIKGSILSNEIGAIYKYLPLPGMTGAGVVVSTPPAIDPQYLQMLEFWLRQAYETKGISQLSAQAKKPSGLNSGVALQTVEDVESERHNPMLQSYVRFLMDVAKVCIEVFPKGEDILPRKMGRARIQWSDIKQERDSFSIQFSASSSLSKDPKVKMEQIEKLIQMGIVDQALAASLLEFPDLESAYSIRSSSYDYCQRIIERAVEEDVYEFYEVVNIQQLFGETANTLLRLDSNEESLEVLERLVTLLRITKQLMDEVNQALAPPPPPPETVPPPSVPAEAGASPLASPEPPPETLPPPAAPPQVINVNLGATNRRKVTIRRGPNGELLGADVEEGAEVEPQAEEAPVVE